MAGKWPASLRTCRPRAPSSPQAADALAAEEAERGKRVVVVVDEGHLLGADQLEELRLLTNAEMDSDSPFAFLMGQPTLRRRIKLGAFAALDQHRPALRHAGDHLGRDRELPRP